MNSCPKRAFAKSRPIGDVVLMSLSLHLPQSFIGALHAGAVRRMTTSNVISVLYRHLLKALNQHYRRSLPQSEQNGIVSSPIYVISTMNRSIFISPVQIYHMWTSGSCQQPQCPTTTAAENHVFTGSKRPSESTYSQRLHKRQTTLCDAESGGSNYSLATKGMPKQAFWGTTGAKPPMQFQRHHTN